jgi:hypothetical protein
MNHTSKFLLFLVGSLMWVACHADCIISPTGTNAGNCTSDSPCGTITYCLTQFSGDLTISLSAGTYIGQDNCDINVVGGATPSFPAITSLVVQALPNNTVTIDCQSLYPHFRFQSINALFTLNSITLLAGNALSNNITDGGCLYASGVQGLTVQNVAFVNCIAYNGGALFTDSPTSIMDSTFSGNKAWATTGFGGALIVNVNNLNSSIFSMSKSVITNNTAPSSGAAVYIAGDYASITDCNITFNSALSNGGGVFLTTARPTYVGNYNFLGTTISNNTAVFGGGLYNDNLNHTFNVFGALFTGNIAGTKMAATADPNIYCSDPNSTFCYSCAASDCLTGCAAGANQSCTVNAAAQAFCYSTKFTTCSGNSCKCSAKSGLPTAAKIVIIAIAACLVIGIFLIAIDVIRHFRQKKQGYTPISS